MSRRNTFTSIVGAIVTGYAGWQTAIGRFDEAKVWTIPAAIVSFATGRGDDELKRLRKLVGGISDDDRHAARSVGRIVLDRVVARLGYQVELRDGQQPARVDYGGGAISDRPGPPLTEIQTQDASAAAWEEARRLRQQFQRPQIPRGELQDWQEFNDRGTPDEDGVIGTEGWP